MKLSIYNLILLSAVFAIKCVLPAQAEIIPLVDGQGTSAGWSLITTDNSVDVHVDQIGDDQVTIRLEKTFNGRLNAFGFFDPIVIEFQKTSELARSLIKIDSEIVVNDTTHHWYDYHIQLMVNSLNPEAGFSKSVPDGDQLENVSYDQSQLYGYLGLPIQLDFLNATGGGVSNQPKQNFFRPGLVEGDIYIKTNAIEMETGQRFGIKQVPTIPEPATLILLTLGAVPAIRNKCRK